MDQRNRTDRRQDERRNAEQRAVDRRVWDRRLPAGAALSAVSYTHLTLPTNREV